MKSLYFKEKKKEMFLQINYNIFPDRVSFIQGENKVYEKSKT